MAIIQKIKNKVIDVASDIMSAPARISAANKTAKADRIFQDAKTVRDNKGKPDSGDYTDPLFRARVNNNNDKFDAEQKAKKLNTAKKVMAKPSNYETDYAKMRGGN